MVFSSVAGGVGGVLLLIGGALWWMGVASDAGVVLTVLGGLGSFVGVATRQGVQSVERAEKAYEDDANARAWMAGELRSLAARYGGSFELGDLAPAVRFLEHHWPDKAPMLLLEETKAIKEERWYATGSLGGLPFLVAVVTHPACHPNIERTRSPALVVLVARLSAPPVNDAAIADRLDLFERRGLSAHLTRAGACAFTKGPAHGLLEQRALEELLHGLVGLAHAAPAAPEPPAPLEVAYPLEAAAAVEALLRALASGDGGGALLVANYRLMDDQPLELDGEELMRLAHQGGLRPQQWSQRNVNAQALTNGRAEEHNMWCIDPDGRRHAVTIALVGRHDGWSVSLLFGGTTSLGKNYVHHHTHH